MISIRALAFSLLAGLSGWSSAQAATLTWDADPATAGAQDGGGTWDAANTNWWDGVANAVWNDVTPDRAIVGTFSGTGGVIQVFGARTLDGLTLAQPRAGAYTLTNGSLTVGAGGITLNGYVTTNLALDDLTTAPAGAWSLRRLRAAYAGAAVKVRRPSDNATQDIGFDAGGFLDTNALALFLGSETGTVARWFDQSGNARDGVQTNNANQPLLHNPNGKWAILGRNSHWLTATNCTVTQMTLGGSNGTAVMVYRGQNVAQGTFGWYDASTRWFAHINWSDGNLYWDPGNAAGARISVANGGNNGVWQQYSLVRSNGNSAIRWGGVDRATSGNRAGNITTTGTTWGVLSAANGTGTPYANGDMVEYIQFANGLGSANLSKLELSQGAAFGIAIAGVADPLWNVNVGSAVALGAAQTWMTSNGAQLAVSGVLSGSANLAKNGPGIVQLAGSSANANSGTTTVNQGAVYLSKTAGPALGGDLVFDNNLSPDVYTTQSGQFAPGTVVRFVNNAGDHGRLELVGTTQRVAGIVTDYVATRGVIQNAEAYPPGNAGTSTLILDGSDQYFFGGYLRSQSGTLGLTKVGSGTQTLWGTVIDYTGPTIIGAGTLVLTNVDDSLSAGAFVISNGASLVIDTSARNYQFNRQSVVTGAGSIVKIGAANAALIGANAQGVRMAMDPGGLIDVQAGILRNEYGQYNVWTNNRSTLNVNTGAFFYVWDADTYVGALTGGGTIEKGQNNAHSLVVGMADASSTFAGTLRNSTGTLNLRKVGAGTLTLSGTNTYTGATLVSQGILSLAASGSISNSTFITVSNAALLDVTSPGALVLNTNQSLGGHGIVLGAVVAQPGARLSPGADTAGGAVGTLTITGNVGLHAGSTNVFHLSGVTNEGGGFNDLVQITGDLEPSGSVVRVEQLVPLASGSYRLFTYTGSRTTAFNPTPVFQTSPGRKGGYVDVSTAGQVDLVVTGSFGNLTWLPQTSAVWNATEANWSNAASAVLDLYLNSDAVTFDEAGAYSSLVTLAAAFTPGSVTVAGASNYTFAGAAIAGVGGLTKTGAGTLTILNTNTYTGPTVIDDGVLHLGAGGNLGVLAGTAHINVTNTGTLSLYTVGSVAFAPPVRGNGTWLVRGPGVSGQGHIEPAGDNSGFSGTIVVTNLRLVVNNPLDVGAGSVLVQDRGQIWLQSGTVNAQPLTLTGLGWVEGAGQLGAIRLSTATNAGPVTLAGYSRICTYSGGERGTLSGPISGGTNTLEVWNGNGGYTYLTGTNTFRDLNLLGGWTFFGNAQALGTGTVIFSNGGLSAHLQPLVVTNPVTTAAIGMHVGNDGGNLPVTFDGDITIGGTHTDTHIYNTTTVNGAFIGGTKGIYKYQAGHLRLAGTNTLGWLYNYTGGGTISLVSNSVTTVSGNLQANGGGTVRVMDNAQATFSGGVFLGESNSGGGGNVIMDGGVLTTATSGYNFRIGHWPNNVSTFTLNGGTVNAANAILSVGWDGTGRMFITNGTLNVAGIQMDSNGNSSLADRLELSGSGVLALGASGLLGAGAGGPQTVLFGGGRVTAMTNWTAQNNQWITLTNTTGATTFDTAGHTIQIDTLLIGVGGLNKSGAGRLVLNGLNTYAGPTTVSNGELAVNGRISTGAVAVAGGTLAGTGTVQAAVSVAAGAVVQPGNLLAAGALTVSSATFAADAVFHPLATGTDSVLRVTATNGLTLPSGAGTAVVHVLNAALPAGTYTILDYEGAIQGGDATNLVLGAIPLRSVMYLTNNTANSSIDLVVVSASESIRWLGNVDGTWNIDSPTNWVTAVGGVPTVYQQTGGLGDGLLFDDTAAGNFAITLLTNVTPSALVASNDANAYAIGGYGIGGLVGLQKFGAATFTLAMNNSFLGGTTIRGGTLQLGDGTNAATVGSGPVSNDATLAFAYPQTNAFGNTISGTGAVVQNGAGQVTLSAINTYSGATVVNRGRLVLTGSISQNSPVTVVTGAVLSAVGVNATGNSGATLTPGTITLDGGLLSNDGAPNTTQVLNGGLVLSGGGTLAATAVPNGTYGHFFLYNNGGKIVSTGDVQNLISAEVHFAGTHTIEVGDGAAGVDLLANNRLSHHHGTSWGGITKTGDGTFKMTCPTNAIAGTALNGGRVIFSNGALGWPDTPANKIGYHLADFVGTTVLTWDDGNTQDITTNGNLRLQDAATAILDTGTNNLQFARAIVTAGAGTGSVVKTGAGTLTLHATNTYSGLTTVSNGTLLVQGQVAGSVTVAGGTLGGTGVVLGAVTSDGTVAPGASAGQFLIAGDYTQNAPGTLSIELGGGTPGVTYDELLVGGTATLAGELKVRLIDGFMPATNDLFLILDAGTVAGTFASTDLPVLPAGQGWEILYLSGEVLLSITSAPVVSATGYDLAALVITNGLSGYNDDADGDGYANLLEYVTGGSLTNADTNARMSGGRTNNVLALKFLRDTAATDATIYVEGSYTATNNADWVGIATNIGGSWGGSPTNVTESGSSPVNVTVQDTESAATNRFLRLRVTRP